MKKVSVWIIILAVVVLAVIWGVKIYNKIVTAEEGVGNAWGNVENVYQRRADLIPNLVASVQGAADYEKSTLEAVITARAAATSTKIDPTNLTEENMAAFQQAQDNLSSALSKLLVVVERYPELKANQNFLELQAQLEGTENRIAVERNKFNETVQSFNTMIRRFPANIVASIGGFSKKAYFKAAEGSDVAPKVELKF
ncbi:MAG: LemA family protein [Bacteroidales bacterium]|nr:LemA family protein [Bacteroidales bacterium]MDD4669571.1 LemA family protein [Bacteroidales bacterium]